ncbi:carboxypeptidase regulatory-like domain-containing protein [Paenibacillus tarimensis]
MKVSIKIKHLVLAGLSGCILWALFFQVIVPKLQVHFAQEQFEHGSIEGKERLLHVLHSTSDTEKWELIRKYIIEPGPDGSAYRYNVYIGPDFVQTNDSSTINAVPDLSWEEKLPYLEAYLNEGPADGYMVRAAKQLAYYYGSEERLQQALEALELGEERLNDNFANQRLELMYERAKLYAQHGEAEKAEWVLDELSLQLNPDYDYLNGSIVQLRAQLLIRRGDIQEALKEVSLELEAYKKELEREKVKFPELDHGTPVNLELLTQLEEHLKQAVGKNGGVVSTLSGTVKRSDGTPMAQVGVYLRERKAVHHSVIEGEPYQTITDTRGRFEFTGVLPGSYQLAIGIQFAQIDGWTWPVMNDEWIDIKGGGNLTKEITFYPLMDIKEPVDSAVITGDTIRFRWEPVDGAAYYNLNGTLKSESGSVGTVLQTHIPEAQIELPVEALYDNMSGIVYSSYGEDEPVIDTSVLLGFANPENRFSWSVEAFDKDGKLLTRSNGYRLNEKTMGSLPFFYLNERSLTEVDRLLLERRLDEAMDAYKKAFDSNRQDRHSLRMIIRLYDAKSSQLDKRERDPEALPYIKQMVALNPTGRYISMLVDYYYSRKEWASYSKYYEMYAEMDRLSSYQKSIHATALMKQGKLEEAGEQFAAVMEEDLSHRFIGNYLAVELYTTGSFESAAALADKYPERSYGAAVWSEVVEALAEEAKQAENPQAYWEELKEKLEWFFNDDQERYDQWRTLNKHRALRAFMKALHEVR